MTEIELIFFIGNIILAISALIFYVIAEKDRNFYKTKINELHFRIDTLSQEVHRRDMVIQKLKPIRDKNGRFVPRKETNR